MKSMMTGLARKILVTLAFAGSGYAQQAAPEKHVKDIQAEQTKDMILASPLCRETRDKRPVVNHVREIDSATLEPDMNGLMENSDEVVLAGIDLRQTIAIAPSGEDVVQYFDVKVLRSWKGSHKVGEILTFAIPFAALDCAAPVPGDGMAVFWTMAARGEFRGHTFGPYVLFLRQSKGAETELTVGLRPAGGDGLQGMYPIGLPPTSSDRRDCNGALPGSVERCTAFLNTSQAPVSVNFLRDPLLKKYDGMPIANFLKVVTSVANSLGYMEQAASSN